MPIKAIIEKLEEVTEEQKAALTVLGLSYTPRGGKFELTGAEGLKTVTDTSTILAALNNEKTNHATTKALNATLQALVPEGSTVEDVQSKLLRLAELEVAAGGRLDKEKIDQIVEQRINAKLVPVQTKLREAETKLAERDTKIADFNRREDTRLIHQAVREAGPKAGLKAEVYATDDGDAIIYAERVMKVIDDPTAPNGKRVVTKDGAGVTPGVEITALIPELLPRKTHWQATSQGTGADGSSSNGSAGLYTNNPWTAKHWNKTNQSKIAREKGEDVANQMARSAGLKDSFAFEPKAGT